jgi:hypothetical protein
MSHYGAMDVPAGEVFKLQLLREPRSLFLWMEMAVITPPTYHRCWLLYLPDVLSWQ